MEQDWVWVPHGDVTGQDYRYMTKEEYERRVQEIAEYQLAQQNPTGFINVHPRWWFLIKTVSIIFFFLLVFGNR